MVLETYNLQRPTVFGQKHVSVAVIRVLAQQLNLGKQAVLAITHVGNAPDVP